MEDAGPGEPRPAPRGRAARSSSRARPAATGAADRHHGSRAAPRGDHRAPGRTPSTPSEAQRAAASSMASGMPSSRSQMLAQGLLVRRSEASAPAAEAARRTGRAQRDRSRERTTGSTRSPGSASGSRLVASRVTIGGPARRPRGAVRRPSRQHVLAVVEHDEPRLGDQGVAHDLDQRLVRSIGHPEGRRDGFDDGVGAGRHQVDEPGRGRPSVARPRWPTASCRCRPGR